MFKAKTTIELEVIRDALETYRKLIPKNTVGFQACNDMIKRIDNYRVEND